MSISETRVTEILKAAHGAVVAAGLPQEFQGLAFEKAIELLAGTTAVSPSGTGTGLIDPIGGGDDKTLAKIAGKLGVSVDAVGEVFHVDGEALALGLATSKLSTVKATAVKEIALLVAAGRQGGGWDAEWTETGAIRPIVEAYGKLDGNFAATITGMADDFSFSGNAAGRKVKLKRKGFENATALVKRLAGED